MPKINSLYQICSACKFTKYHKGRAFDCQPSGNEVHYKLNKKCIMSDHAPEKNWTPGENVQIGNYENE